MKTQLAKEEMEILDSFEKFINGTLVEAGK
jgi:hypothetical protein